MTLRIALIGNFSVEWATANDLKDTIERLGGVVEPVQEQQEALWTSLIGLIRAGNGPDAVIWNRTPTLSAVVSLQTRQMMLSEAARAGIPTIAFHLDRWWGLKREREVFNDPYFRCQYVFTADGHDPARWKAANVNHFWSPPAIAERNCVKALARLPLRAEIGFIGTWGRYHPEWQHRDEMIDWMRRYFGKMVVILPQRGYPQLRGQAFSDQVASFRINVGDSCLVPDGNGPWTRYCSDRVFEVPGRGGFLIHPGVQGVCWWPAEDNLMVPGRHIGSWTLGDWDGMRRQIVHYLENEDERRQVLNQGFEHVRNFHTYRQRMQRVLDVVGLELS